MVCIAEKYKEGNILFLIENVRASKYYYTIFFFFPFYLFINIITIIIVIVIFLAHCNITY